MATRAELDKLRKLGAVEISAQTHISRENIEALLESRVEKFNAVQLQGFISILEREYDVDLSELRTQFTAEQAEEEAAPDEKSDPFMISVKEEKRRKRYMNVLAMLLILIIIAAVYALLPDAKPEKIELNNTALEAARDHIEILESSIETNASGTEAMVDAVQEAHQTQGRETETAEIPSNEPATIYPRNRVWVGIIDAQTHKRSADTTAAPVVLDANRSWLVITGHGFVNVECDDQNRTYNESGRLYFVFEPGSCRRVDVDEFKLRNQGRVW